MKRNGLVDLSGFHPVWVPLAGGTMIVSAGKATESLSTLNGGSGTSFRNSGYHHALRHAADGTPIGLIASVSHPINGGGGKVGGNP
jgi:hypothetical protein